MIMNPYLVYIFHLLSIFILASHATRVTSPAVSFSKIKSVNLGGWLVTEDWIKPSLFDGILNGDLLDGTQLQFKSVTQNIYLCAENGGGARIIANCTSSGWETFKLWRITENTFQFRVLNWQFIGLDSGGKGINLVAVSNSSNPTETFTIVRSKNDMSRVRVKAPNGFFLQVKTDKSVTADYRESTTWDDHDPSVFLINNVGSIKGEFQVTNGHGANATAIMREHWNTFIVEEDFKFISQNRLNAVRIPVGWWIASDPNPPFPFVGGSLHALDNAFMWAEKYGIGVIVDLHAAPGSQNGWPPSATRDGFLGFGKTNETVEQTLAVIDFLASRYAKKPNLLAIELLNEPSDVISFDTLAKFYQSGYNVVRKYSSTAYVVMCNRLFEKSTELVQFASRFHGSVIDLHYYNLYGEFSNLTVKQNIDYVYNNRSTDLRTVTKSNGALVFIGEWTSEWEVKEATKKDYQKFASAQLKVFERATFGWSYWTLKVLNEERKHWSLEWMVANGYIKLETE